MKNISIWSRDFAGILDETKKIFQIQCRMAGEIEPDNNFKKPSHVQILR